MTLRLVGGASERELAVKCNVCWVVLNTCLGCIRSPGWSYTQSCQSSGSVSSVKSGGCLLIFYIIATETIAKLGCE